MKELRIVSIANALVWAAAIIGTAIILRGTPQAGVVVIILGGAAGGSIIALEDALRRARRESITPSDSDAPAETKDR